MDRYSVDRIIRAAVWCVGAFGVGALLDSFEAGLVWGVCWTLLWPPVSIEDML